MDPKEKARRMMEKALRMPLNDVILEVQKGTIKMKDIFDKIDEKVKEVEVENG